MVTFAEALSLAQSKKAKGHILDYYVDPISHCIIAECDQGCYVLFNPDDWDDE